jgi:hypothetical protein
MILRSFPRATETGCHKCGALVLKSLKFEELWLLEVLIIKSSFWCNLEVLKVSSTAQVCTLWTKGILQFNDLCDLVC